MNKKDLIKVYPITPDLKLLNIGTSIPGYGNFLGAYLLCGEKNILIDVGPQATIPNLLSALAESNVNPQQIDYIILTHIHIDHAGGIGAAIREMSKARVLAHSRARPHLIDPSKLWEASLSTLGDMAIKYGNIEPVPEDRIIVATDLMKLDIGCGIMLEIHFTPGHASHHLSLFDRAHGLLIAGETAGVCIDGSIRPATPPPFKMEETLHSLDRLIALKPEQLCYGHFGCYDNATERLKLMKQKILEWHKIINSAAKSGKHQEEILSILRKQDNNLDYLNNLDRDTYQREHLLLINDINGLCDSYST